MSFSVSGAVFLRASRNDIWTALHDVEIVSSCIPGCRSLACTSDRAYQLALEARLGPMRVAFNGSVEVERSEPPRSYCLVGHGVGDLGRAQGRAAIEIKERVGGCLLTYKVEAETHGALSSAGPLVLAGVGKALAIFFARRFSEAVDGRHALRHRPTYQRV